jgi:hypothetical protein
VIRHRKYVRSAEGLTNTQTNLVMSFSFMCRDNSDKLTAGGRYPNAIYGFPYAVASQNAFSFHIANNERRLALRREEQLARPKALCKPGCTYAVLENLSEVCARRVFANFLRP